MTALLIAGLALLAAGCGFLAWLLSVAREELAVSRRRAEQSAAEVELERERSKAEIERRAAERGAELQRWAEADRTRWVEQERAQLVADAEARTNVRFEAWRREHEEAIRKDAVARSTATIRGNVSEQLAPFFTDFNPRDCRFLGSPVDFVIFDGLYSDGLKDIVFLEIKTGESSMNARERSVRDAVQAGRVRWEMMRL